ncbi:MAG: hypothetical protein R3B13_22175 [Polyangiaceae bacterium]
MRRRKRCTQLESRPVAPGLLGRAWRHRRRGEHRRAMLTLREACYRESGSAKLWTLYAVQCMRAGIRDEATRALRQALWLRQRRRDDARVAVTLALLARVERGDATVRLAAA